MTRYATHADYARLGVPAAATTVELKAAFRKLALRYHPDRNPDDADASRRFAEIADSYEACLRGPAPRATPTPRPAAAPAAAPQPREDLHERMARPGPPAYSPRTHRPRSADTTPRPVAALPVGAVVWADYTAILVAPDRIAYLDPAAPCRLHVDRGTQVRIERHPDGFHVELPASCRHRWSATSRAGAVGMAVRTLGLGDTAAGADGTTPYMPARLLDSTVARMAPGERAWTVAGALVVTADGRAYIDGSEQTSSAPSLTTPVRVERRNDGWHVVAQGRPSQWAAQGRRPGAHHIEVSGGQLGGVTVGAPVSGRH